MVNREQERKTGKREGIEDKQQSKTTEPGNMYSIKHGEIENTFHRGIAGSEGEVGS